MNTVKYAIVFRNFMGQLISVKETFTDLKLAQRTMRRLSEADCIPIGYQDGMRSYYEIEVVR
jgi:hypothetical protein